MTKLSDLTKPIMSFDSVIQSILNLRDELARDAELSILRKEVIWKMNSCLFSKYPTLKCETMKVYYGYINPTIKGGKYISGTTLIPINAEKYEDFIDFNTVPYMTPNSDSLDKMVAQIETGAVYVSWDASGNGVFGIFRASTIYLMKDLELQIFRTYLNSL